MKQIKLVFLVDLSLELCIHLLQIGLNLQLCMGFDSALLYLCLLLAGHLFVLSELV